MKRRLQRLEKLQRLREIARVQAMREAAEALGALSRARLVAQRSGAITADTKSASSGEGLHDQFRFGAALTALREDAAKGVRVAQDAAASAQGALHQRTREHDVLQEQLDLARRAASRPRPEPSPALARSLNSTGAKPAAARRTNRDAL